MRIICTYGQACQHRMYIYIYTYMLRISTNVGRFEHVVHVYIYIYHIHNNIQTYACMQYHMTKQEHGHDSMFDGY